MKNKIGFLFPGQGSQYVGMGKDLYDNFQVAKDLFKTANEKLDFDITALCFEGPEDKLKLTENTQSAILTVSTIVSCLLRERGITPVMSAGHSLGEYSALVDAGCLTFEDAVQIVNKRGKFMQEAVPPGEGTMAAIIGMSKEDVEKLCLSSCQGGTVTPANYNSPGQIVIAGNQKAVEDAVSKASQMGAKRAILLPVSAPFHCSMMKPAEVNLSKELDKINFCDFSNPIVTNVDAVEITSGSLACSSLKRQVTSSVLWENSMRYLIKKGVTLFIEAGPGRVLSGLMRSIDRSVKVLNVEDVKSLEKAMDWLETN